MLRRTQNTTSASANNHPTERTNSSSSNNSANNDKATNTKSIQRSTVRQWMNNFYKMEEDSSNQSPNKKNTKKTLPEREVILGEQTTSDNSDNSGPNNTVESQKDRVINILEHIVDIDRPKQGDLFTFEELDENFLTTFMKDYLIKEIILKEFELDQISEDLSKLASRGKKKYQKISKSPVKEKAHVLNRKNSSAHSNSIKGLSKSSTINDSVLKLPSVISSLSGLYKKQTNINAKDNILRAFFAGFLQFLGQNKNNSDFVSSFKENILKNNSASPPEFEDKVLEAIVTTLDETLIKSEENHEVTACNEENLTPEKTEEEKLKEENSRLLKDIACLNKTISETTTQINSLREENEALQKEKSTLEQKTKEHKDEKVLETEQEKMRTLESNNKGLRQQINEINEQLEQTKKELESTKNELHQNEAKTKEFEKRSEAETKNFQDKVKANEQLQQEKKRLENNNEALTKQLEEAEKNNNEIRQKQEEQMKSQEEFKKTLQELEKKNEELRQTEEELKRKNEELMRASEDSKKKVEELLQKARNSGGKKEKPKKAKQKSDNNNKKIAELTAANTTYLDEKSKHERTIAQNRQNHLAASIVLMTFCGVVALSVLALLILGFAGSGFLVSGAVAVAFANTWGAGTWLFVTGSLISSLVVGALSGLWAYWSLENPEPLSQADRNNPKLYAGAILLGAGLALTVAALTATLGFTIFGGIAGILSLSLTPAVIAGITIIAATAITCTIIGSKLLYDSPGNISHLEVAENLDDRMKTPNKKQDTEDNPPQPREGRNPKLADNARPKTNAGAAKSENKRSPFCPII